MGVQGSIGLRDQGVPGAAARPPYKKWVAAPLLSEDPTQSQSDLHRLAAQAPPTQVPCGRSKLKHGKARTTEASVARLATSEQYRALGSP